MGNRCSFCEEKTDTDILILNDNDWLEFCPPCGEKQKVTNFQKDNNHSIKYNDKLYNVIL